jgi:hypothetical protein
MKLNAIFDVKDLGEVSTYVGINVKRDINNRILTMDQSTAFKEMVNHFGRNMAKSRQTPFKEGITLGPDIDQPLAIDKPYRSLLGSLMHPMVWTRPDLSYAVGSLSQFMHEPRETHWNVGLDVLSYVNNTVNYGLRFVGSDSLEVIGYADSDWGADLSTGRSVFGYAFFVGGNVFSWKSKKSTKTVATSSTLGEIDGLYEGVNEGIWITEFLHYHGLIKDKKFLMRQDNKSAIALVKGEKILERTKHAVIKISYLRQKYQDKLYDLEYTPTAEMTADIFTKSLGKNLFVKHRAALGLQEI